MEERAMQARLSQYSNQHASRATGSFRSLARTK